MRHRKLLAVALSGLAFATLGAVRGGPATALIRSDDRVTPDHIEGSYARLDGSVDPEHAFCSASLRQQAEPAVAVNPRDPRVIVAGATDQCYGGHRQVPIANGQGWTALYRSTDGGSSWRASLMPDYPGDANAGMPSSYCGQVDVTMAFDNEGRLFYGALCPDLRANEAPGDFHIVVSTFDTDGSRYVGTVGVDEDPSGAPDLTTAPDKPNLAVDTTSGPHAGNVYVAYTSCPRIVVEQGPGSIAPCVGAEGTVNVARSTDHGTSFSAPVPIGNGTGRPTWSDVAVGPDGHVYVTATNMDLNGAFSEVLLARSTDGGATFTLFTGIATVKPFNSAQFAGTGNSGLAANSNQQGHSPPCGDGVFACVTGFTFSPIRTVSAVTADADGVHLAWSAQLPSGQAKVFVQTSPDGVNWPRPPVVVDPVSRGHQWYPDIASADGTIRVVFYDSRVDPGYAPNRPPGNTAEGVSSGPSVDTYETWSRNGGRNWTTRRLSTVSSQPGLHAQLGARAPWVGDYLYVSAVPGGSYAVWTDARDVVPGRDTRGGTEDGFDVAAACSWMPAREDLAGGYPYLTPRPDDACLSKGGLDVNIYGATLRQP
ncbi:MAG TPA: sialidase family protein [Mycobacteriales bacterium]|nr:sialidase family protein [Mycobacteriales bacterium]